MKLWYSTTMVGRNEADAVRSTRPKGKKCRRYDKRISLNLSINRITKVLGGLFTSQDCHRCKASAHEAVVYHRKCVATKHMG